MEAIVSPSKLKGSVMAPASKSAMQRACAAALLHKGTTILSNPGISADDKAALDIIKQLGAVIEKTGDYLIINSKGISPISDSINCGESGLSVRMFTSIAALSNTKLLIQGSGSLTKRPLSFFDEVFPELDVQVKSANGFLPLEIRGPLVPKNISIDGSLSSQFLTGLLMAYSAADARNVTITVNNLNSRPYIDLTLSMMEKFGLELPVNKDYKEFYFQGNRSEKNNAATISYTVEADWSGGSFLLVGAAISGAADIKGLNVLSTQADKTILQALSQAGASLSITEDCITVRETPLKAFHFNATDSPDLFPPLVVLAACCEGTSVIEGVNRLAHKESNRALTLKEEFEKMGIEIKLQDNLMLIKGGKLKGTETHAHHDHRIAMACGVAALRADGKMSIKEAEAVNKSYPDFWQHLQQLGAGVSLKEN